MRDALTIIRSDRRYLIVFGACLTQFTVIGLLLSYGLFFKTFEVEFGWSRTLLSSGSSLAFLVMGGLAAFGGQLSDRYGPRLVLAFTGTMCGLGFVLLSYMSHAWQLLLGIGLFVGMGMSTHDVVTLSTITHWFVKRRGIMTGIVKIGTAAGQFSIPPIAAFLLVTYGWRPAFMMMGLGTIVLLLVAAWAFGVPPATTGSDPTETVSGYSFAESPPDSHFLDVLRYSIPVSTIISDHSLTHCCTRHGLGYDRNCRSSTYIYYGAFQRPGTFGRRVIFR